MIEFDEEKRLLTLLERRLDMRRAGEIFLGQYMSQTDSRLDYGEERIITAGRLDDHLVILVWTRRGSKKRIISMRKANEREIAKHKKEFA